MGLGKPVFTLGYLPLHCAEADMLVIVRVADRKEFPLSLTFGIKEEQDTIEEDESVLMDRRKVIWRKFRVPIEEALTKEFQGFVDVSFELAADPVSVFNAFGQYPIEKPLQGKALGSEEEAEIV